MGTNTHQFIQMLLGLHKDGMMLQHFARYPGRKTERSTMPVSAFIYQYFLYNTLYSIDWDKTQVAGSIVYHPMSGISEGAKQHRFEKFLQNLAKNKPRILQESFAPLTRIELNGSWTAVVPDSNISQQDGELFFRSLEQLVQLSSGTEDQVKLKVGKIFSRIETCRRFVYAVRNNIFHGTKTLGEMWDPDQRKRIHVYYQFLNCLVSCFFELVKRTPFTNSNA